MYYVKEKSMSKIVIDVADLMDRLGEAYNDGFEIVELEISEELYSSELKITAGEDIGGEAIEYGSVPNIEEYF